MQSLTKSHKCNFWYQSLDRLNPILPWGMFIGQPKVTWLEEDKEEIRYLQLNNPHS